MGYSTGVIIRTTWHDVILDTNFIMKLHRAFMSNQMPYISVDIAGWITEKIFWLVSISGKQGTNNIDSIVFQTLPTL